MILSRTLDTCLRSKRVFQLDRNKLAEFGKLRGIISFKSHPDITPKFFGNILVDESLSSPIQVIDYEKRRVDEVWVRKRVYEAWNRRMKKEGEERRKKAYRVVNNASDRFPGLSVDLYGEYAVVYMYSGYWRIFSLEVARAMVNNSMKSDVRGVYLVDMTRGGGGVRGVVSKCIYGKSAPNHETIVEEADVRYLIRLNNGASQGLYLDQRLNRAKVVQYLLCMEGDDEKSVLNTFSFTCGFSIAIAKACKVRTVNVDMSEKSMRWARENYMLNGLNLDEHEFIVNDVMIVLAGMNNDGSRKFDMIILDPPTVSHVEIAQTREKFTFSTTRNYGDLVALAAGLVKEGGYLFAFTNTHSLNITKWKEDILNGIRSMQTSLCSKLIKQFKTKINHHLRKIGIRAKIRRRTMKKITPNIHNQNQIGTFELIDDQLTQDPHDFPWHNNIPHSKYLNGLILRRNPNPPHLFTHWYSKIPRFLPHHYHPKSRIGSKHSKCPIKTHGK